MNILPIKKVLIFSVIVERLPVCFRNNTSRVILTKFHEIINNLHQIIDRKILVFPLYQIY